MDADAKVQTHLDVIRSLQAPSGLFLASASTVSTGYDKAWLRDNFYTVMAFQEVEDWDTVRKNWRAILNIFLKHEDKINWAAQEKPTYTYQYIHARYHPETFEEFWEEWGNKQNDAIGAILFAIGTLEEKAIHILETDENKRIVQHLVNYLGSIEYWRDPDNGVWEENEEIHASSVGAALAGLQQVAKLPFITVPQEYIFHGQAALNVILPRESMMKFTDLALLSLIFPYKIVLPSVEDEILKNLEYHLRRRMGIIRYKNDHYYNKNHDGYSEEAEWTMGFPWLSIIYTEKGDQARAKYYLDLADNTVNEQSLIPELYYSNTMEGNENTPLGWAESLYVVAYLKYKKVFESK